MVLDSALADAEIRGDVLAGLAGEDQFHDLALSPCQADEVLGRGLPPRQHRLDQQIFFMHQGFRVGKRLTELRLGHQTANLSTRWPSALGKPGTRPDSSFDGGVAMTSAFSLPAGRKACEISGGGGRGALIQVNLCPISNISALLSQRLRITLP